MDKKANPMDKTPTKRNYLRLVGTKVPKDAIEKMMEERIIEGIKISKEEVAYNKIPTVFTNLQEWPTNTNLRCWVCGFSFDGAPKFMPTYLRQIEGAIEFGVEGNMCTFNCVSLYIIIKYEGNVNARWNYQNNLAVLYKIFTGRDTYFIKPAYPKTRLKMYGGDWTEEQFWDEMRKLDPITIKDHTPGSIIPDRQRINEQAAAIAPSVDLAPAPEENPEENPKENPKENPEEEMTLEDLMEEFDI